VINETPGTVQTKIKKQKSRPQMLEYLRLMSKDYSAILGMVIVGFFLIWSLIQGILEYLSHFPGDSYLGYVLLPSNPILSSPNFSLSVHAPSLSSLSMIMGTNFLGESILSRILYAMPRDAFVSVVVVLLAVLVGALLGITAAFKGGLIENVIMRLTDAFLSLPALIIVIAIAVPLKEGFDAVIIALSIVWWPTYTRFFRAQTLKVKEMDYVQAAKINNVSRFNMFLKYLFLNSVDPVIAYAALDFGNVILTYSTLAFLGIGLTIPIPELGAMASDGLGYLPLAWWWALFPGITILIIVIGFVLVGDRFQDIINNRINY